MLWIARVRARHEEGHPARQRRRHRARRSPPHTRLQARCRERGASGSVPFRTPLTPCQVTYVLVFNDLVQTESAHQIIGAVVSAAKSQAREDDADAPDANVHPPACRVRVCADVRAGVVHRAPLARAPAAPRHQGRAPRYAQGRQGRARRGAARRRHALRIRRRCAPLCVPCVCACALIAAQVVGRAISNYPCKTALVDGKVVVDPNVREGDPICDQFVVDRCAPSPPRHVMSHPVCQLSESNDVCRGRWVQLGVEAAQRRVCRIAPLCGVSGVAAGRVAELADRGEDRAAGLQSRAQQGTRSSLVSLHSAVTAAMAARADVARRLWRAMSRTGGRLAPRR